MPRRKPAPKAPRCRGYVELGTKLPQRPDTGRYAVCVTPSQWRTLFPAGIGPKLGCGVFACAWATPGTVPGVAPDTVVKITRDRDDVAGLLATQGHPRVVTVQAAYRLERSGTSLEPGQKRQVPVYALVVERVKPFPRQADSVLKKLPFDRMLNDLEAHQGPRKKFSVSSDARFQVDARCAVGHGPKPEAACKALLHGLVDTYEDLVRKGIVWLDVHPGNLGVDKHGRWKILDLGNSLIPVPGRPPVTALRGVRRLRIRRVKRLR